MKKVIFIAIFSLLASCCNSDILENRDITELEVIANMAIHSRATLTSFEVGDKISLYAVEYENDQSVPLQISGNYINNEPLVYNGTRWESSRKLYWSNKYCDFYGIYPYQQLKSISEVLFDVATDQSTLRNGESLGGYEASDLLWAKAERISQSDGAVNLQFNHMMSRLVVKIEKGPNFQGDIPDDIITHIYNTSTTAKIDFKKGSLEKYALSKNKTITMHKINNQTFDAIIVPQFIERSTPLVEITMGGIAYLLNYSISFLPGYQHIITIILNTSPDQEKIEISIDGRVENWS